MFAYDEVPYDTKPNAETHPASMAILGRLFGLAAAPPARAHVLELGCGNGENLLAAATYLPEARFVGFDLAERAIREGEVAAAASGAVNVALHHRDVRDVRARPLGRFDYVIAHGLYSWVPEDVRGDVLAVMRAALEPSGIGFLSVNALPGWELTRALRELARHATREQTSPEARVKGAIALAEALERAGAADAGFLGLLAGRAQMWREHVARAKPPGAPFSWYAFHDLLAPCNEPFSVSQLDVRLAAAGLRRITETPLDAARAAGAYELGAAMETSGLPFLQILVCRDDASPSAAPLSSAALDLLVRNGGAFVSARQRMREAAPDLAEAEAGARVVDAFLRREILLFPEPLAIAATPGERPRVALHVLARARAAVERGAASELLTSAFHVAFQVPLVDLVVVEQLDGEVARDALPARVSDAVRRAATDIAWSPARVARHVEEVLARFAGHGFLVER